MKLSPWILAVLVSLVIPRSFAQPADGFIFPPLSSGHALPGTQPDNHASTVVELNNGDILAAWFAGTHEGKPDVAIYGARLHNGTWSAPFELARAADTPCWNPVLFHSSDDRLWLYYKYGSHPSTWMGARKWSRDEGRTWSAEEHLPAGILGPIKDKPLVLGNGVIVSGSSVEGHGWAAWIERSEDDGKTWSKSGPITIPETDDTPTAAQIAAVHAQFPSAIYPPRDKTVGIIQPSVVSLGGQHLRFYARSQTRVGRIAIADSTDNGKTWTQARYIDLPNPNSGIDAVRLRDGRIVLIFNNSYNQRTPLNLAVSRDSEHFTIFKTLEDAPGQYSYPAIVQAANGDLLMTYSWKRQTIKFVRLPLKDVP